MESFIDLLYLYVKERSVSGKPGYFKRNSNIGTDVYATCDVVNILYSINKLSLTSGERGELAAAINSFQNPITGQYEKSDHRSEYHSTAMAVSALKLLGEKPKYPTSFLHELKNMKAVKEWLKTRDWEINPWNGCGHDVPALMSIFSNLQTVDAKWFHELFNILDDIQSENTGMWPKETNNNNLHISHLGSAFHFYFMYEHYKRPINFADEIITSTLHLQNETGSWFDTWPAGFIDLDATYTLSRLSRFNPTLREKSLDALTRNLDYTLSKLQQIEAVDSLLEDTHNTLGTLQNVAVLQEVFPEMVDVHPQLKLVLNYSPFI